ncbi:DUF4234 domain-containing protein [Mycetocola zhadangensis]|uniref:DUF4234 domain-containing protein n=1 Tax=Mycetocola zhadangensis TaxID=1164595 RepID=UPI001603856A|nr:DUF4234 domain-containing protein [Mycetocola zhadangensis]GGE95726.1 hypothetical protein GCM10011313_18340 [Mycetocola zhadangensis]
MKQRSAAAVFFLPLITFGIYWIVWLAKTRGEVNGQGTSVPTTWLFIVPFVSIWWLWTLSAGISKVSGGGTGGKFALLLLLGNIGATFVQAGMNTRSRGIAGSAHAFATA